MDKLRIADVPPVLLDKAQAARCLGISARTFEEIRGQPWCPSAIALGPRCFRWSRAELEAAVANMPRQQQAGPEPKELLRARIERAKVTGDLS
jgi:predicted DNA-binding transcriptional regulator AlpA